MPLDRIAFVSAASNLVGNGNGQPQLLMVKREVPSFTLELKHGWNLCALPFTPDIESQGELLQIGVCWGWNNGKFEQLNSCETGQGFWIYSPQSKTIVITGFEKKLSELKKAKKFIFMEYFIYEEGVMWDSILEILKEKVKDGVEVRVMYDDAGCITTLPKNYDKKLEKLGIKCIAFNKITPLVAVFYNNRDHRKILVIDGEVAFSGGINIADEYINKKQIHGHWKDNGFMIKGEAVWSYTVMFLRTWNSFKEEDSNYEKFKSKVKSSSKDGYILPYGFNPLASELIAENVYLNIINSATDYLYIFTPYLIIDHEMINALGLCAKRGVDVRIVTPGIPDKKIIYNVTKSYYNVLAEQGIKIYEYTPGFIHAKVFVCDDKVATVGTINMDYRSLYLHFECGSLLYNSKQIKEIKKDAVETIKKSKNVTISNTEISIFKRIRNAIFRILSPLL